MKTFLCTCLLTLFGCLTILPHSAAAAVDEEEALKLKVRVGQGEIILHWEEIEGAETYEIRRKIAERTEDWKVIGRLDADHTRCHDEKVENGTRYYYQVCAYGPSIRTVSSDMHEIRMFLGAPNVRARAGIAEVELSWDSVHHAETYEIRVTDDGYVFRPVEKSCRGTSFTHKGLQNGVSYSYKVFARNSAGLGLEPYAVTVELFLDAPRGLRTRRTVSGGVELSWSSVQNATQYKIYESPSANRDFTEIGSTSMTSFRANGNSKTRYYRVRAANKGGPGEYSESIRVDPE